MAVDDFGTPSFGLFDCKVATWNSTDSYGTAVDVAAVQMVGLVAEMLSGRLEGDDQVNQVASTTIAGEGTLRFGGVRLAALEIIMGVTATSSVASPNQVIALPITGGDAMPYFGLVGRAKTAENTGDMHIFIPKMKITGNLNVAAAEYGQFSISEVTALAVSDATYGIGRILEYQTSTAVVVPPANIT